MLMIILTFSFTLASINISFTLFNSKLDFQVLTIQFLKNGFGSLFLSQSIMNYFIILMKIFSWKIFFIVFKLIFLHSSDAYNKSFWNFKESC